MVQLFYEHYPQIRLFTKNLKFTLQSLLFFPDKVINYNKNGNYFRIYYISLIKFLVYYDLKLIFQCPFDTS